jgi:hypothetical protein
MMKKWKPTELGNTNPSNSKAGNSSTYERLLKNMKLEKKP